MALLDAALALLEQGFRPIPLGAYQETPPPYFIKRNNDDVELATEKWPKTPRIKWKTFQSVEPTEEQVTAWWTKFPDANIGLVTGCEFFAVDADSKEAMEWCETYLTFTPWRVVTSNGCHYYYAVDKNLDLRNFVGTKAKVDIRGEGGYVVAAGSRHASGTWYTESKIPGIPCDSYTDLPVLTQADVQRITSHNKEPITAAPKQLSEGALIDLSLFDENGDSDPIGEKTTEGSRNVECSRLAGLFFRQGYSIDETMDKCMAWNAGNIPPLPDGEVAKTVDSVSKTVLRKTGQSVPEVTPPEKRVDSLLFNLGQLTAEPPQEPEMFWGDKLLFRQSRVLIAGAPKIGKSRFALAMGVSACTGGQFLNAQFRKPLKFMWLQAEIHRAWLPDRISQVTPNLSRDERHLLDTNLILSGRLDLDLKGSERDYMAVQKAIEAHKPDILCIDPIIEFSTAEENSNVEVRALLRRINALAADFDCATIIVHHTKKPSKGGSIDFDQVRGASAFRGWFDTGVMLTGEEQEPLVSWEARNTVSPAAHMAWFDRLNGRYEARLIEDGEIKEKKLSDGDLHYSDALNVLRAQPQGISPYGDFVDLLRDKLNIDTGPAKAAMATLLRRTNVELAMDTDGGDLYYAAPGSNGELPPGFQTYSTT